MQGEALESLRDSLRDAQRVIAAILADVDGGSYTPEEAAADYELLTTNEPFSFIGDLGTYADYATEEGR
jgi:hypothetical protein